MLEDITEARQASQLAVKSLSSGGRTLKLELMDPSWAGMTDYVVTQDTLGMMQMQEFFNKVTDHVESFAQGPNSLKLGQIIREVRGGESGAPKFSGMDADEFESTLGEYEGLIDAFFKLVRKVPELQLDIYVLTLGVTRDQEWFRQAISEPPHRGGFTVDEGFDILKVFIRQNAAEIKRFFTEQATSLVKTFTEEMQGQGLDLDALSTGGKQ